MNVLELFSGTGSVGKVCKEIGFDVVSVDLLLPADFKCDIMDFDYKQFPKDYFGMIWASPPCVEYSICKNSWLNRKLKDGTIYTKEVQEEKRKEADKLVAKSLEIINYFKPELWCIENPSTGDLKNRDVVKGLPYYDIDYCRYCDWGYKKPTRIWTNKKDWNALKCEWKCNNLIEIPTNGAIRHDTGKPIKSKTRKLHKVNCGKSEQSQFLRKHKLNVSKDVHTIGERKKKHKADVSMNIGGGTNRLDRYRIPPDLIYSLILE